MPECTDLCFARKTGVLAGCGYNTQQTLVSVKVRTSKYTSASYALLQTARNNKLGNCDEHETTQSWETKCPPTIKIKPITTNPHQIESHDQIDRQPIHYMSILSGQMQSCQPQTAVIWRTLHMHRNELQGQACSNTTPACIVNELNVLRTRD